METIILDYTNANVILWKHEQVFDVDDMEERILEKFWLKWSSIEWMSSESLDFDYPEGVEKK